MASVLLAGFSSVQARSLMKIYKSVNVSCEFEPHIEAALEKIPSNPPSLVVVAKHDDIRQLQSLNETLRVHAPITPFLAVLKKPRCDDALEAMRAGAFDCLTHVSDRYRVLTASKRATQRFGRSLFVQKINEEKSPLTVWSVSFVAMAMLLVLSVAIYNGPPPGMISLGSANLSGIQWQGRSLWVGDWFDSIVTEHVVKKSFLRNARVLVSKNIFKMQDTQPILIANSDELLFSIGSDLKMRSHQRSVGLPALQTQSLPAVNPTGLVWSGQHVWSCDATTNMIYQHGDDLRVVGQVRSVLSPLLGLAHDGHSFWVVGGTPLKLMKLTVVKKGALWDGPYLIDDLLAPGVNPTGVAVGFDRVWLVSGGDPRMVSQRLSVLAKRRLGWTS